MTQDEYRSAIDDVIYLVSCAVNEKKPDPEKVAAMDISNVYTASRQHMLTAAAGMALQKAGVSDARFAQEIAKAQRKTVLMDADRHKLSARLEEEGIWYLPLKGIILKDLYPEFGMRQMSDNDILVDASRMKDIRAIMESIGFTPERLGKGYHDIYFKPPVSNFEIHSTLFQPDRRDELYNYYRDVPDRLLGEGCEKHMSDEDLYVYLAAHEYKHYTRGGTGLRSLADTFLYLQKVKPDMDYVAAETEKLGISDFEQANRSLAVHLFGDEDLTAEDRKMLDYITESGTYGTVSHSVENKVNELGGGTKGKTRYLLRRMFPSMDTVRLYYPEFAKHPILLPFLPFLRMGKALTVKRHKMQQEIKTLFHHEKKRKD